MIIDVFSNKMFKTTSNKTEVLFKLLEARYKSFNEVNGTLVSPFTYDFTPDDLWKSYELLVIQMQEALNLQGTPVFNNMWCNVYTPGTGLAKHDHTGIQFTGLHIIKQTKDQPQTVFFENETSENSIVLDLKEGDVIIFPGTVFHEVPINETDDVRITSVFTFAIE